MIPLLTLMACGTDAPEQQAPVEAARPQELPELNAVALARRISLDVRGKPPTLSAPTRRSTRAGPERR